MPCSYCRALFLLVLLIKYLFVSLRKKCDMECPKCSCEKSVKSGIIKGRQRYKCKECACNYTVEIKSTAISGRFYKFSP
jgi:transposase-like protein